MTLEDQLRGLVARIAAVPAKQVGVDVDYAARVVLLNWPSSMALTPEQRATIKKQGEALLPATLRSFQLSIT